MVLLCHPQILPTDIPYSPSLFLLYLCIRCINRLVQLRRDSRALLLLFSKLGKLGLQLHLIRKCKLSTDLTLDGCSASACHPAVLLPAAPTANQSWCSAVNKIPSAYFVSLDLLEIQSSYSDQLIPEQRLMLVGSVYDIFCFMIGLRKHYNPAEPSWTGSTNRLARTQIDLERVKYHCYCIFVVMNCFFPQ